MLCAGQALEEEGLGLEDVRIQHRAEGQAEQQACACVDKKQILFPVQSRRTRRIAGLRMRRSELVKLPRVTNKTYRTE